MKKLIHYGNIIKNKTIIEKNKIKCKIETKQYLKIHKTQKY